MLDRLYCRRHVSVPYVVFFSLLPPPPSPTLFPYTTLFRSSPGSTRSSRTACSTTCPLRCSGTAFSSTAAGRDRKSTRLNSSHITISYAVFCLKKKKKKTNNQP